MCIRDSPTPPLPIQIAQIAIPPQTDHINHQHPQLQRHIFEVHKLHQGPDHPVTTERGPVRGFQLFFRGGTFEKGHCVEEEEKVAGGEDGLVEADAGEDGGVGAAGKEDAALEEAEPGCGERAEDCWSGVRN